MALLTDTGTPGVSDPGFLLARACIHEGIEIECLPGATAFVPALVNSGIPMNRFAFEGFLPPKKGRQTLLSKLSEEGRTLVFYESPMRLLKTFSDFAAHFGSGRRCSISRELAKLHEENRRDILQEVHDYFKEKKAALLPAPNPILPGVCTSIIAIFRKKEKTPVPLAFGGYPVHTNTNEIKLDIREKNDGFKNFTGKLYC